MEQGPDSPQAERGYGQSPSRINVLRHRAFELSPTVCRSNQLLPSRSVPFVKPQPSRAQPMLPATILFSLICWLVFAAQPAPSFAADTPVHGLWVWKTASVLEAPGAAETLRKFCQSNGITEVYVSVSIKDDATVQTRLTDLIDHLHKSGIRVEALLGSNDADIPGKPRDAFLNHIREIVRFNQQHPTNRYDGIHLDIEPHQRTENKGADNLAFLPNLVETLRSVRALAEPARMTVNADIAVKFLKADASARRSLLTSVPSVTLMLYEQSSPQDGSTPAKKAEKIRRVAEKYLTMAYAGLADPNLARMSIALRTPDYVELLPSMLQTLDTTFRPNPHYLGWARHSYNDVLKPAQ